MDNTLAESGQPESAQNVQQAPPAPIIGARYRRIMWFFASVALQVIWWEILLPRIGLRSISRRTRSRRLQSMAAEFRALAIRMGGVLIKVGQFLSARLDVLPAEIVEELAGLQDEVPPEDFDDIRRLAEAELGATLLDRFEAFEQSPMAAASLGQAHRARVKVGSRQQSAVSSQQTAQDVAMAGIAEGRAAYNGAIPVVVKVQRPNIETIISTDLAALRVVGGWLQRYEPIRRRADVPALLAEFTRVLYEELDYIAEGHHAETFAQNFRERAGVVVPGVIWSHTTRRVLTLEDVSAIKITDYDAITAAGIDRAEVARRLFDAYLKQIFDDGFFHADPHPGNLFVSPSTDGTGWKLAFIDFGMVGRVPENLRMGLREAAIAIGTQDAGRLIGSYQQMGVLLTGANVELLEKASAKAFSQFWGRSMSELRKLGPREMRRFTGEFRELMYDMPFQVPEDLILLGRCMAILSGMCAGLDPKFNLWTNLEPYAQKLISEEAGSGLTFWLGELGSLARGLVALPRQTGEVLNRMERGDLSVNVPEIADQVARLEASVRRMTSGVIFGALLLGGIQLALAGQMLFSEALMAGAGIALIVTLLGGRRRRR